MPIHLKPAIDDSRFEDTGQQMDPDTEWIIVNPVTGEAFSGTYGMWVERNIMQPGMSWGEAVTQQQSWVMNLGEYWQALLDDAKPKTGGGRVAPIYSRPDRRLVVDAVKGAMTTLTGRVNQSMLDSEVEKYLMDDRANFDNKTQDISPMAGVLERIRATTEYKAIHDLRPDAIGEEEWIGSQVGNLLNAGVSPQLAVDLGIAQATVGATPQTSQAAGEIAMLHDTGRLLDSHKNKMRESIFGAMQAL